MKQLQFTYDMTFEFDAEIAKHYYSLKCFPYDTARQEICSLNYTVFPAGNTNQDFDSYGNKMVLGYIEQPHTLFAASITGTVTTGNDIYEEKGSPTQTLLFRNQSERTVPGEVLQAYYAKLPLFRYKTAYDKAFFIMKQLHRDFQYVQGVTDIQTTAEQAMALGKGVCQDYAHIMLALCRMAKIPARYVVGMMVGEGFSHAWVEVLSNGFWYGMDPTNDMLVQEDYIKISHGRDYRDTIVNKGSFLGTAKQKQTIRVIVKERNGRND